MFYLRKYNLPVRMCGGWDSNPRTPTGQGPKPCAFDQAWLPPLLPLSGFLDFGLGLNLFPVSGGLVGLIFFRFGRIWFGGAARGCEE